jgi:hypothetical protein
MLDFPSIKKLEIPHNLLLTFLVLYQLIDRILQPTLSSWRTKKIFPRADEAAAIASSLNTTVEYLVSGKDTRNTTVSPAALNIAVTADTLSEEGQKILTSVADSLALKFPRRP